MPAIEPSYLQKVRRAKHHYQDLEASVAAYTATDPYEVVTTREGKRGRVVHRFQFTRSPENTDIPIIFCDLLYNLRSGLDHLAAHLVPRSHDGETYFPILWQGVWEPGAANESEERKKDRGRWTTITRHMPPEAVSALKEMQPSRSSDLEVLPTLNQLGNAERHRRIPVVNQGLDGMTFDFKMPDGQVLKGGVGNEFKDGSIIEDGARINAPPGAIDIRIHGTPLVAIEIVPKKTYIPVVAASTMMVDVVGNYVDHLIPYVRR